MSLLSYPQLYRQVNGRDINVTNILVDFEAVTEGNGSGDQFFEQYGPGNTIGAVSMPYERMEAYEKLLLQLADHNLDHFRAIHKGTPYYFMAWTAFQIGDYEKAVFYLDTAVSEDLRLLGSSFEINTSHTPGIDFLLLTGGGNQAGLDAAVTLLQAVEDELSDFSRASRLNLTRAIFIQKFVKESNLFKQNTFRTILTTLYSFILEFHSRSRELYLRSSEGGSIEPFLTHLFKGCLVLESLLKLIPPGDTADTLGKAIELQNTKLGINRTLLPRNISFEDVIILMNDLSSRPEVFENICFPTAYGLRNTTGHKLAWPDVLENDDQTYTNLYKRILGSIFWTIYKLWVE